MLFSRLRKMWCSSLWLFCIVGSLLMCSLLLILCSLILSLVCICLVSLVVFIGLKIWFVWCICENISRF